jgi:hypothetical protein
VAVAWAIPFCLLPFAGPTLAASPQGRAAIAEAISDATAHGGLCRAQNYTINALVFSALWAQGNFVDAEIAGVGTRTKAIAARLRGEADDVICRDMIERYGPDGNVAKNLLVPK